MDGYASGECWFKSMMSALEKPAGPASERKPRGLSSRVTPEVEAQMVELARAKVPTPEIAEIVGRHVCTVRVRLKKRGFVLKGGMAIEQS